MKEILTWGDCTKEFKRLNINPKCTWSGYVWREDDNMAVYEVTEEEFEIMDNDTDGEDNWDESLWRYSEGSNQGYVNGVFTINNKSMKVWDKNEDKGFVEEDDRIEEYIHLLEYLCNHVGASQPRNVCALSVDLAKYNNMTLAELFKNYQG